MRAHKDSLQAQTPNQALTPQDGLRRRDTYYAALHHIAVSALPCRALFVHLPATAPDGMPHLTRFAVALLKELRVLA